MKKIVKVMVFDDAAVHIDGERLIERSEIMLTLNKILESTPDAIVSIEADDSENFRAIGKAIYGSHLVGFPKENIIVTVGGKIISTQ